MLPIVRLVREKVAGRALRPFAEERGIPYSTLRYYHDEKLPPLTALPRAGVRQQLADALRVSLERIDEAAVASLAGRYDPSGSEPTMPGEVAEVEDAILSDPDLLPEVRDQLVGLYRLLRRVPPETPDDLAAHRIRHEMRTRLEDGARQSAAPEGEEDAATPAPRQRRGRR